MVLVLVPFCAVAASAINPYAEVGHGGSIELTLQCRSKPRVRRVGCPMSEDVLTTIREQIDSNRILLYMKGSPQAPQCGFSAQTVQCLMSCGERFAYVDILGNPEIRATLPQYADWPTFPQLYVNGELIGGCDIVTEMHEAGELEPLVREAAALESDSTNA